MVVVVAALIVTSRSQHPEKWFTVTSRTIAVTVACRLQRLQRLPETLGRNHRFSSGVLAVADRLQWFAADHREPRTPGGRRAGLMLIV